MEKFLPIFSKTRLFQGLTGEEIRGMLTCLDVTVKSYDRGAYLLHAGDVSRAIGLVLSGEVHLTREDFWGNHDLLTAVRAGETFAEAAALLGDKPLLFEAVATEATEAVFFPVNRLIRTCSTNVGCQSLVIENLLAIVAERNLLYERKCGHLSHRTTREKLLSFLSEQSAEQNNAEITIPFNRQELADYLSVDRSAMSAELSRMQADGLLRYEKSRFRLLKTNTDKP